MADRPKYGGRIKGSVNLKTEYLHHMAMELDIHPFKVLLQFAAGDWKSLGYKAETVFKQYGESVNEELTISPELRMSAAAKACEYLYPKRKAVEHTLSEETVTHITRNVISKQVK